MAKIFKFDHQADFGPFLDSLEGTWVVKNIPSSDKGPQQITCTRLPGDLLGLPKPIVMTKTAITMSVGNFNQQFIVGKSPTAEGTYIVSALTTPEYRELLGKFGGVDDEHE